MEKMVFIAFVAVVVGCVLIVWGYYCIKTAGRLDLLFHQKYDNLVGLSGYIDKNSKVFTVLDKDLSDSQRAALFKLKLPDFRGAVPNRIYCKLIAVHRSEAMSGFMELKIEEKKYGFRAIGMTDLFIHFCSPEIGEFRAHREDFPDVKLNDIRDFKLRVKKSCHLRGYQYSFYVDQRR